MPNSPPVGALSARDVVLHQRRWTEQWHEDHGPSKTEDPWQHVEANHRMNFDLWHEEDIARRDDLGPERVRQAKRAIDGFNQARNDAMERIDGWVQRALSREAHESAIIHTETPGMIIDRLSILSLKSFHMAREASRETASREQRELCAAKHSVIEEQLEDLQNGLQALLDDIAHGNKGFKLYKQFKMYNDPQLNPQLYASPALGDPPGGPE